MKHIILIFLSRHIDRTTIIHMLFGTRYGMCKNANPNKLQKILLANDKSLKAKIEAKHRTFVQNI